MIIDIKHKDNTGTLAVVVLGGSGLPNLVYNLSSSKKIYESDFGEYELKYKPLKEKYNSSSILNYLIDSDRKDLGYDNTTLLDYIQDFSVPTYTNTGSIDDQIGYFGSMVVEDRIIYIVDVPPSYSHLYLYSYINGTDEEKIEYRDTLKDMSQSQLSGSCDVVCELEGDEIECGNTIIFSSSTEKDNSDLNLSYHCWNISENPARFKNKYNMRNDEFLSIDCPDPVVKIGTSSYLGTTVSGDLMGCTGSLLPQKNLDTYIYEIIKGLRGGLGVYDSGKTYMKGDHCIYGWVRGTYTSKVDNNIGNQPPRIYNENDYWEYLKGSGDLYTWSPEVSYKRGDICVIGEDIWYSLSGRNYNNYPPVSSEWINYNVISDNSIYDYTISVVSNPMNSIKFFSEKGSEFAVNKGNTGGNVSFLVRGKPGYKLDENDLIPSELLGPGDYTVTQVSMKGGIYLFINITLSESVIGKLINNQCRLVINTIALSDTIFTPSVTIGMDTIYCQKVGPGRSCQVNTLPAPFSKETMGLELISGTDHNPFESDSQNRAYWRSEVNGTDSLLLYYKSSNNLQVDSISCVGEDSSYVTVPVGDIVTGSNPDLIYRRIDLPVSVSGNSSYSLKVSARNLRLTCSSSNNLGVTFSEYYSTIPFGSIDSLSGPEKKVKFKLESGYTFSDPDRALIIKCFYSGSTSGSGYAEAIFTKAELEGSKSKSVSIQFSGSSTVISSMIYVSYDLETKIYEITYTNFHFDSTIYVNC